MNHFAKGASVANEFATINPAWQLSAWFYLCRWFSCTYVHMFICMLVDTYLYTYLQGYTRLRGSWMDSCELNKFTFN
jgi:hypothetical protein